MKFTIKQEELKSAVQRVVSTAATKTTIPVLSNILLEAKDGAVTLTTTDLSARSVATVAADVSEAGTTTVPTKGFSMRVANLEGTVTVTESSGKLTLKAGSRRYTIDTLPADQFPKKADNGGGLVTFSIGGSYLGKLLHQALYAAEPNPDKVNQHCVQISSTHKGLRAFGIDGHRFAMAYLKAKTPEFSVAIPQGRARELSKLLSGVDEDVKVHASRNLFAIEFPWGEFSTALPNAQVPQVEAILDIQRNEFTCTAPRDAFLATVKALEVATGDSLGLHMTVSSGTLECKTSDGVDQVPVEYQGAEESAGVNIRYMVEALTASSDEEVRLSLSSMNGGAVDEGIVLLRPAIGEDWLAGIMPVRK